MADLQATSVAGTLTALREETITTASLALALANRDRVIACTNTTAINITVPADASVNFPIGSVVYIARLGTGTVTLLAAGGVTLTKTGTLGTGEELYVRKRAVNSWVVVERPYELTATGGTIVTAGNLRSHSFTTGSSSLVVQS
tara:strand:- start:438 stop:869 length:432 start_codon:yes stop_codon:yes gene_type:complete